MIVVKSKYGGFCFGVKRAIDTAEKLTGDNNYILGEIIHNNSVNEKLKKQGIKTINSLDEVRLTSSDTLLIRTHGESQKVFDELKQNGVNVIDCTCPFVKDIQKKVAEHYKLGYQIIIVGSPNHPEVKGINGWCENSAIITSDGLNLPKIANDKICVVVQTTFSEKKFEEIVKNFAFDDSKTVDIFKTICYTTTKRQKEAYDMSKEMDAIIVLGGANSNNTQKLYEICKGNCENVFYVVDPNEFDYEQIKNFYKVGIVLGASTPNEQFQEVISKMGTEEIITTDTNEVKAEAVSETFEATQPAKKAEKATKSMEDVFNSIKPSKDWRMGQIVTAVISSVTDKGLTLSLNTKVDSFELPKEELIKEYNKDDYTVGDKIKVMVIGKNPMKFSEKAMEKIYKEEALIEEIKNGKVFEAKIDSVNKGGLVGKFGSYQVFVPSSQIKLGFVKDLEKYVGKTLRLKAEKVESKGSRRQIVGSQRVILLAEKEERDAIKAEKEAEFFGSIQEGDVVLGTPVRFANFGAFIDVNGFDCLAHISDLSWTGCEQCSDVLELGKQYEFIILKIDEEKKKVSIGYKQLQPKPWDTVLERYNVGDTITGKVVRIVPFGAFVEVEKGIDGLVHVSQISDKWLENPVTALEVGQEVTAKIIDISPEREKMNLSIKALLPTAEPVEVAEDAEPKKKGKKSSKKTEDGEVELREWKDDNDGGITIADMINN